MRDVAPKPNQAMHASGNKSLPEKGDRHLARSTFSVVRHYVGQVALSGQPAWSIIRRLQARMARRFPESSAKAIVHAHRNRP